MNPPPVVFTERAFRPMTPKERLKEGLPPVEPDQPVFFKQRGAPSVRGEPPKVRTTRANMASTRGR